MAADNFVFDCVINALLCRMFSQPEYAAMFRDFYPEDQFPACLLPSPEGWSPAQRTRFRFSPDWRMHDGKRLVRFATLD